MKEDLSHVSKENPCPHCGKPDWCYFLGENLSVCKRGSPPAEGWQETSKSDKEGTPYYGRIDQKWPSNWQERIEKKPRKSQDREWIYTDIAGNPLIKVKRIDREGKQKKIWQEFWIENGWYTPKKYEQKFKENLDGSQHSSKVALYKYQEIQEAIGRRETIWIVEGEPIVDLLWSWGIPATTNLKGSKGWEPRYSKMLEGASLVLCPDRDKPGVKLMEGIAQDFPDALWCYPFPNSPIWNALPDSDGLDILDWVEDRATQDNILAAVGSHRDFASTSKDSQREQKTEDGIGFETSDLFDKLQKAKSCDRNIVEIVTFAGCPKFAEKLAQSADVMNVDPWMIWAYDAPASLSLLPSTASIDTGKYCEPSILDCAIVIESGEGKTRAAKLVLSYLHHLEKQARERYDTELADWKQNEAAAKKEKESFTEPPRLEKAIAEVATIQALLRRLNGKARGMLWARDELKGLFSSLGQFSSGESEDREICLQFWDGSPFSVDRVKMEDSFYVDSSRVSIVGGIQPGILAKVFTDPDDAQGMAARFLFHVPKLQPYSGKKAYAELAAFYPEYFKWVKDAFSNQPKFRLSDNAQTIYDQKAEELFWQGREESNPALAAWLKKAHAHALRLSLAFHLHQCFESQNACTKIGREAMQAAFFAIEQCESAFLIVQSQLDSENEAMVLEKIQQKAVKAGRPLAMQDFYRNINSIRKIAKKSDLGLAEYTQQLCKCLQEKGLGRVETVKGRVCYSANKRP